MFFDRLHVTDWDRLTQAEMSQTGFLPVPRAVIFLGKAPRIASFHGFDIAFELDTESGEYVAYVDRWNVLASMMAYREGNRQGNQELYRLGIEIERREYAKELVMAIAQDERAKEAIMAMLRGESPDLSWAKAKPVVRVSKPRIVEVTPPAYAPKPVPAAPVRDEFSGPQVETVIEEVLGKPRRVYTVPRAPGGQPVVAAPQAAPAIDDGGFGQADTGDDDPNEIPQPAPPPDAASDEEEDGEPEAIGFGPTLRPEDTVMGASDDFGPLENTMEWNELSPQKRGAILRKRRIANHA